MLLSYFDLVELVRSGVVDAPEENINAASIDIRLGPVLLLEQVGSDFEIDISRKQSLWSMEREIPKTGYRMHPGEFLLAHSMEKFNLPAWLAAEYKLKSSMARVGLEHLNAGWCDPGWHNSHLTLELKNMTNHHWLTLRAGMKIGQVVFYRTAAVPDQFNYSTRGRYNDQESVVGGKGVE